jgi:hypothetical protein
MRRVKRKGRGMIGAFGGVATCCVRWGEGGVKKLGGKSAALS